MPRSQEWMSKGCIEERMLCKYGTCLIVRQSIYNAYERLSNMYESSMRARSFAFVSRMEEALYIGLPFTSLDTSICTVCNFDR
jgi:hypothetical protein